MRTFLKIHACFVVFIVAICMTMAPASAKDTLVVSQRASATTLHPLALTLTPEQSIVDNIYDGLIDRDPSGKLIPSLATSWELVNPTTWRFHLRKGVKWHTGDPFTAEDVKFTFEVAKTPINRYRFIADKIKDVKIIDTYTVEIITKAQWPVLVDSMYQTIFMMSKKYCTGKTDAYIAEHPMGTGSYVMKEWVRDSHIHLEAFKDCWRGIAPIKKVTFRPISNDATRLAGLITGEIDLTTDVPVQYVGLVEKAPNVKVISRPGMRIIFLMMRMNRPDFPTAKTKVRRALMLGINEREIIQRIMYGRATAASQLPADFVRGYNKDIARPEYDPEGAKKLLAEAGYPNGFAINLHVPNNRYVMDKEIGVAIAQQLSKIGVRVNLIARPKAIHFKDIRAHKLDFMMMGWAEATFDGARLLGSFLKTGAVWNGGEYSNKIFDAMLEAADGVASLEKRAEELRKLNQYVADNTLVIPLHYQQDIYGVSKKIKGFVPNVKKVLNLHKLSF
ncbi:MAG: ABC transporter substrate-binding protein [Deltaproteobacteria bacterium]|nr:ABC transporter substrate-binding protein [Deltaproteobacteria bacterium]MBW2307519.1 ABC transporter substrate-binding protein [Deltaproteobacteria bacterium]